MLRLDQDIKYLKGVGPQRAELLARELAVRTVGDLLTYYPYKYVDRSRFYRIAEINGNMPYVQLLGEILSFESFGEGRKSRLVAHFSDGTGVIDLVWFRNVRQMARLYDCHKRYVVFGKPQAFNGRINVAHPEMEQPAGGGGAEGAAASSPALRPAYSTTERMKKQMLSSSAVARLTATLLHMLDQPMEETLPKFVTERYHLASRDEALRSIHYPADADALRRAQARLKFEELFYVQLNIVRYARDRARKFRGFAFRRVGEAFNDFFFHHLPFPLTEAQKRVVREMRADMGSGRQMNRLLQGDVGSGKTLVALMCALIAIDNGYQACVMAPTEILAEQHVATLRSLLGGMAVGVELLTGTVRGKRRADVLGRLAAGDVHILVGTHAVIEDNVQFARLGLVVIDEQHRFGVAQRARLWQKSATPPHVLVMTATPIPRTLAMTLYGDLDVSVIDELPPGRKPVATRHMFDSHRRQIDEFVRRQVGLGRQVYVVYPLIKESEKIDIKNLEDGYEQICATFADCRVSKVHGQLKPAEKEAEMQRFARGETQILVATTVIEVGVNVPNASVMVVENAERFGLSQLHQLRGRVGRGADQSYCILVTDRKLSEDTRRRIQIMVDTNDGFEIAEQDLRLRGPGDLEGTQQSGMALDLKIANLAKDGVLLQMARDMAQEIVEGDPDEDRAENQLVWRRLRELRKTNVNWGAIS